MTRGSTLPIAFEMQSRQLADPAAARLALRARSDYLGGMAKKVITRKKTTQRSSTTGQFLTVRSSATRGSKVKFGSVTVSGAKPSAEAVKTNVERSTQALARVTKKLASPGVVLREKKDVPQFSVAEGETGVFIRRLNGRTDRGKFVNGSFQVGE